MLTANADGSDLYVVADHGMVSHFIWKNDRQILAWANEADTGTHFYLYADRTGEKEIVGGDVLRHDGHCTFSPDGTWVLTDGYPDKTGMQPLMLYRPSDGTLVSLGRFFQAKEHRGEWRCDLHPRWSRDGQYVCVDSMHAGKLRQMYLIDTGALIAKNAS